MAASGSDKIKYGLLKAIDVSSFKVFDPVVRLLFGEEPRKQVNDIFRYMITPMLFVGLCLLIWTVLGPQHKTKSGEVPTPAKVWEAKNINERFAEREKEKESDFLLTGPAREAEIAVVETRIEELTTLTAQLEEEKTKAEARATTSIEERIAPLEEEESALSAQYSAAQEERETSLMALSEKVAAKEASTKELIAAVRDDKTRTDLEKEELSAIASEISEIRSDEPKEFAEAKLAANAAADELQHFRKRLEYLNQQNRSVKVAKDEAKAASYAEKIPAAEDGPAALKAAESTVKWEERAAKTADQEYAPTATVFWQGRRSLFAVFCGFLMAAAIAIPVGIMCGLNRVVMACFTPIISILRWR